VFKCNLRNDLPDLRNLLRSKSSQISGKLFLCHWNDGWKCSRSQTCDGYHDNSSSNCSQQLKDATGNNWTDVTHQFKTVWNERMLISEQWVTSGFTVKVPTAEILNIGVACDRCKCCADLCNGVSVNITQSDIPEMATYIIGIGTLLWRLGYNLFSTCPLFGDQSSQFKVCWFISRL
jgi:hypothetical protein